MTHHRISRYDQLQRELCEVCGGSIGIDVENWPTRYNVRIQSWIAPRDFSRIGWLLIEMGRCYEAESAASHEIAPDTP